MAALVVLGRPCPQTNCFPKAIPRRLRKSWRRKMARSSRRPWQRDCGVWRGCSRRGSRLLLEPLLISPFVAQKMYMFSRAALWIGTTSGMILVLPVVLETEKLQMEQPQLQPWQILLGPNMRLPEENVLPSLPGKFRLLLLYDLSLWDKFKNSIVSELLIIWIIIIIFFNFGTLIYLRNSPQCLPEPSNLQLCPPRCPISSVLTPIPECSSADSYSGSGHPTPFTKAFMTGRSHYPIFRREGGPGSSFNHRMATVEDRAGAHYCPFWLWEACVSI